MFDLQLDTKNFLVMVAIILLGILLVYLPKLENFKKLKNKRIEHFPKYTEVIRQEPKVIINKIIKNRIESKPTEDKPLPPLPDDFMYLYDFEKNFDESKVYGDFKSRLEAYTAHLMRNRNNFHTLDDNDVNNLSKVLNGVRINEDDIPKTFKYTQDFNAINN